MSDVIQTLAAFLAEPLDATSTQIVVKNLKDSRGNSITSMIGSVLYATIEPTSQNNQEIISFTGITDLGNNLVRLTGVTRNLNPVPPHTALTADVPHGNGATIIITDTPQFWNERAAKDKDENITGEWEFTGRPYLETDADATDNRQFVTKGELTRTALGTTTVPGVVIGGTAGQNLTIRQVGWLDDTAGTWKLANGDAISEVNGTKKLGIILSTTTSGNTITDGVQLNGFVSGYSGLSIGLVYVNDSGNVSNTAGTNSRPIGVAISATEIIFDESITTRLSAAEKAALAGSFGTPGASNVFVTGTDVVEAATASRIPRRRSTGDVTVPAVPTNSTDAASKSYVDGAETLVMGESFTGATTPQPAKIISDLVQPLAAESMIMGTSSITRRALRIIPRQNCTIASVVFPYQFQNAADNAITWTATIQTDSGSNPSGTAITNGTSGSLALNTNTIQTGRYINLTFSTPPSLVAGTTYWVVLTLSSTTASNVEIVGTSTSYASFLGRVWTGSWASGNLPSLELIAATGDSKSVWQCDGNGSYYISTFDGFVTNTGSAGDSATLIRNKNIGGFSGLDTNSDYFLSNTKGTITRNRNEGIFVGTAVSTTQIFVAPDIGKGDFAIGNLSVFNESGSVASSYPMTFTEDGVLTGSFKPGVSAGNTVESHIYTATSYANNTSPKTVATIKNAVGAVIGVTLGSVPFAVHVKKGERIMFASSGTGTNMAVLYLRFSPR